jgi:hypothetical protein
MSLIPGTIAIIGCVYSRLSQTVSVHCSGCHCGTPGRLSCGYTHAPQPYAHQLTSMALKKKLFMLQ